MSLGAIAYRTLGLNALQRMKKSSCSVHDLFILVSYLYRIEEKMLSR
jgi:hypothetical protein